MADYNVPQGQTPSLASVLAVGSDAGSYSITANSGANTIWDAATKNVPQASLAGPAASLSAYPLSIGKDIPAASVKTYAASTDPAYQLSAYPLVPGTDITNLGKIVAKAVASELTATTATTVLTYTPAASGVYEIGAALTVLTAATTVTLTAGWTDAASGAAQTYTFENAISIPVGTRMELPLTIVASSASAITLTATAGTASQVYVSGKIIEFV